MDSETEARFHYALYLIIDKHRMLEAADELRALRREADESMDLRIDTAIEFWRACTIEIAGAWTAAMKGETPAPLPSIDYRHITARVIDALTVGEDINIAEVNDAVKAVAARHVARDQRRLVVLAERRRGHAR